MLTRITCLILYLIVSVALMLLRRSSLLLVRVIGRSFVIVALQVALICVCRRVFVAFLLRIVTPSVLTTCRAVWALITVAVLCRLVVSFLIVCRGLGWHLLIVIRTCALAVGSTRRRWAVLRLRLIVDGYVNILIRRHVGCRILLMISVVTSTVLCRTGISRLLTVDVATRWRTRWESPRLKFLVRNTLTWRLIIRVIRLVVLMVGISYGRLLSHFKSLRCHVLSIGTFGPSWVLIYRTRAFVSRDLRRSLILRTRS